MTNASDSSHPIAQRIAPSEKTGAVLAIALGLLLVCVTGFGGGGLHTAAHDLRHTMAFPCH